MDNQSIEEEIQAKGKTAARVTPDCVEANIVSEHYFTAAEGVEGAFARHAKYPSVYKELGENGLPKESALVPLSLLTFCVLVLKNGFTVTGESACAHPDNFDAEIGRKVARQNAVAKVWPLLGYALKERLAGK